MVILLIFCMMATSITQNAKEFWINLEDPLEMRYNEFKEYAPLVQQYIADWLKASKLSEEQLKIFDEIKEQHFDQELIQETEQFASLFDIPFNKMLAAQYMYDFGAAVFGCTSIVVASDPNFVVRNLDYDFQQLIAQLSVAIHFYAGSKENILYTTMSIIGQISITHTISKSSKASATLNQLSSVIKQSQLLQLIRENKHDSITRFLLKSVRNAGSYEELFQSLVKGIVNVHGNIAMAGILKNEGCILHINDELNVQQSIQFLAGSKYLVVTNGDDQNFSLKRKETALQRLSGLSDEQLSDPQIIIEQILSQYPNNNPLTIYSAILIPNSAIIESKFYY